MADEMIQWFLSEENTFDGKQEPQPYFDVLEMWNSKQVYYKNQTPIFAQKEV